MTYNVSFISQQVGLKLGLKSTSCLAFSCYWFLLICVVLTYWGKFEVAQSIEVAIRLRVENTKSLLFKAQINQDVIEVGV